MPELLDVLVIGAGPVGLACAIEASRQGLSAIVVEKCCLLNTLESWPTFTVFFSTPELLEIGGLPFVSSGVKPTRREGLTYYRRVAEHERLDVRLFETVEDVIRESDGFSVTTSRASYRCRKVIVATGFFDNPNVLGVPGEDRAKVSHYYKEPFRYSHTDVLVIGGKNSAVEAALDLHRNGARVTMAVRRPAFGKSVKYWLSPDIQNRVKEGSIRAFFDTTVQSIGPRSVSLSRRGEVFDIANDFVLALTGYHPDFDFLKRIDIRVSQEGHLELDPETMETTVPGLYVAGVVAAGIDIGKLFIENGRLHAAVIARHIAAWLGRQRAEEPEPPPLRRFQDGD